MNDYRYILAMAAHFSISTITKKALETKRNMKEANGDALIFSTTPDRDFRIEFENLDRVVNIIKTEVFKKFKKDVETYDIFGPDSSESAQIRTEYIKLVFNEHRELKDLTIEDMIEFIEKGNNVSWVKTLIEIVNRV